MGDERENCGPCTEGSQEVFRSTSPFTEGTLSGEVKGPALSCCPNRPSALGFSLGALLHPLLPPSSWCGRTGSERTYDQGHRTSLMKLSLGL